MQYLIILILSFFTGGSFAVLNNLKETETSQDRIATSDASNTQGYHYNNAGPTQSYFSATPSPAVHKPSPSPAPNHQHNFDGYNYQVLPAANHAAFSLGGTPLYQHGRELPAFAINVQNSHEAQKSLENAGTYYVGTAANNIGATATTTASQSNNGGVYFVPRATNHQLQQQNNGYKYDNPQAAAITYDVETYKDSNVKHFFNAVQFPPLSSNYNYQRPAFESQKNTAEPHRNQNQEANLLSVAQNYKNSNENLVDSEANTPLDTDYNYQRPAFEFQKNAAVTPINQLDSQFSSLNPVVSGNSFGYNFNRVNAVAQQQNSYSIQENAAAQTSAIEAKEQESFFKPNYFPASVTAVDAQRPLFADASTIAASVEQDYNKPQYKNIEHDDSEAAAHFQRQISYNEYLQSQQQQIGGSSTQYAQTSYPQTLTDISASNSFNSPLTISQQQTQNTDFIYTKPSAAHSVNPFNPLTTATISNFREPSTQTYDLSHTTAINNVVSQNDGFPAATHTTGNTASHAEHNQYFEESPGSNSYTNPQNGLGNYKYSSSKPFAFDNNLLSDGQIKPIDYLQMQSQSYELPSSHYTMVSAAVPTAPQGQQQQQLSNQIFGTQQEQQQSYNSHLNQAHDQQTSFVASDSEPVRQAQIVYGTPVAAAAPTASLSDAYLPPSSEFQLPYHKK